MKKIVLTIAALSLTGAGCMAVEKGSESSRQARIDIAQCEVDGGRPIYDFSLAYGGNKEYEFLKCIFPSPKE